MDEEPADDLRRRVYGPDATAEDRARYAAALEDPPAEQAPEQETAPAQPAPPLRRRPRRSVLVLVGVLAVVAVAVTAVLLRPSVPQGSPPEQLPVTADERTTLANALVIGTDAGIAAFLVTHRLPKDILDATSADTVEERGVGPADVVLLHNGAVSNGIVIDGRTGQTFVPGSGRVTVLLVVAQAADVGWVLESGSHEVARRAGYQASGDLTSATIAYSTGRLPDRVRIEVPTGVPWGVAAVYTD